MSIKPKILIITLSFLMVYSLCPARDQAPPATELAEEVHDYYVGDNSMARVSMELVDSNDRSRMRKMINLNMDIDGVRKSLIRFLEPADIAGTGFLSIEQNNGDTEQFLYLPALDRTRRIASAQKGRSFVNTDFTYEDMERRPVEDAEYEITGQETIDGRECWILEVRPVPEAASQYSLIINWIPKSIALPVKSHFFDQNDKHIKTYEVRALEKIQDIWTPVNVIMTDHKDGHKTILITESIEYNTQQVRSSLFTTRYLEDW